MYLTTDEQTITDLGIFGKQQGNGIFDIYNRTHTRGGEQVLKEFFRNPLADKDEINRRSRIIEGFSTQGLTFPFDGSLFDMAEKYLLHAGEQGLNGSPQHALGEKEIQHGVIAVIDLMQRAVALLDELHDSTAFLPERKEMTLVLSDIVFEPVLREKNRHKLSYTAMTAYDALFRLREYWKIKRLLTVIYHLDVYLSIAKLALERKFVFPRAIDKGAVALKLHGVYHPELKNPIGNDLCMDSRKNLVFLTGANMAGKSTFLRAMSTALYIAHIGFPVAARSMEFSVMDGIYTTINLPDNLGIGASHFYNEVLRVKKMAAELQQDKSLFIVFDELFRGTNVKDAHEATVAIAEAFAKKKNSLFVISSHIVEAGEELKHSPTVDFRYLPTRMNGHVPEYTYTLEKGITDDRHGMVIIRNEGILEILKNGKKV